MFKCSRTEDRNSVNLDTGETGGMVSSSNNVRRRRKCIWVTSIISGLIAITIIAVTIKTRSDTIFLLTRSDEENKNHLKGPKMITMTL